MRITAACPESLIPDARHLAMVLGFGPADAETYGAASWVDQHGNRYACASWICVDSWVSGAQGELTRPNWDTAGIVDIAAARRAQAAVVIGAPAAPDWLACVISDDQSDVLSGLGLSPLDMEP